MRIGIDISQLAYANTGVANYLEQLLRHLVTQDKKNEYILFYSSLRRTLHPELVSYLTSQKNVTLKTFKIPPSVLEYLWNRYHKFPIETFIGTVDVFISSDWTQPPTKAKSVTVLYDLSIYKYPEEMDAKIISVQKRKLAWVKKECEQIICISAATKKDAQEILGIPAEKLHVIYPGGVV